MELSGFLAISPVLRAGVYALAYRGEVVYVGRSKAMLARVYTHRSVWQAKRRGKVPSWLPVKGILFDEVFIRPCRVDQLDALEREMINLYKPRYNELLKSSEPVGLTGLRIRGVELQLNRPAEPVQRRV